MCCVPFGQAEATLESDESRLVGLEPERIFYFPAQVCAQVDQGVVALGVLQARVQAVLGKNISFCFKPWICKPSKVETCLAVALLTPNEEG